MKKRLIGICLALAVVIIGGGLWFWSLGSVAAQEASTSIVLTVEVPGVEVKSVGGDWHEVEGSVDVSPSDEIRTGDAGRASVVFFGSSVTRLRPGTVLRLEEVGSANGLPHTAVIRLRLLAGRVWSRVINVFDVGSSFSVQTDTVVATVRGTAFDLDASASGTTLWVSDSAVEASADASAPFYVAEGNMVTRAQDGKWTAIEPIRTEDLEGNWFKTNTEADAAFEASVRARISDQALKLGNPRINSFLERFTRASERLHLRFAGEKAPDIYASYVARRLFAMQQDIESGKSGAAFQAFTSLETDITSEIMAGNNRMRAPVRAVLRDEMVLLQEASPSSQQYRFLQRIEDLFEVLASDDQPVRLHGRLLAIDARLAMAARLIRANALEEAGTSLEAAHQGLVNVTSELEAAAPHMSDALATSLHAKHEALLTREATLRLELAAALAPPQVIETPTSTTSGLPEMGTTSTEPNNTDIPLQRITLTAQPNPTNVGATAQLRVIGFRTDGTTVDVTKTATFRLIGSLGSLSGSTYTSAKAGSVTIEASVAAEGGAKLATTVLQIQDVVSVTSLELVPQGSTTVTAGGQVSLTAKVTYSNGTTAIVTPKTSWLTSDPNVGSVTDGVFTAWVNGYGSVTITGRYTEAGKTVQDEVVFIVQPDSATR